MIPFGVDQATIIIGNLALTLKYPDRFPIIYRDRSHIILFTIFNQHQDIGKILKTMGIQ